VRMRDFCLFTRRQAVERRRASRGRRAQIAFARDPLPQETILDTPGGQGPVGFVTQLVCPSTGEVVYSYTWLYTGNGQVPNKPKGTYR